MLECTQDGELQHLRAQHAKALADLDKQHATEIAAVQADAKREQAEQALQASAITQATEEPAEKMRNQAWERWLQAENEKTELEKQNIEAEAKRKNDQLLERVKSATEQLQHEQDLTEVAVRKQQVAESTTTTANATEVEAVARATTLAQSQLDSLRKLILSLRGQYEHLSTETNNVIARRNQLSAEQPQSIAQMQTKTRQQAWAGIPIDSESETVKPASVKHAVADILSDNESDTESQLSDISLLVFSALHSLEETDLSFSNYGSGGENPDQSSMIFASESELQRERQRLARADKLIRAQMVEINQRRDKLQRTRLSWRKDFSAVLAKDRQRGGGSSKLALLESVRKMLDQQERHLIGEEKQLEAVAEYLRLRQDKLQIVETSVRRSGDTRSPQKPHSSTENAELVKRLDSIENELARVLRALRSGQTAKVGGTTTAEDIDPGASLWAERRLGAGRAQSKPRYGRFDDQERWAGVAPLVKQDVNVSSKRSGKENRRHGKDARAWMDQQSDRPVWDYQKLLGQWAEERDLTRELLSQHKVWMDSVKNGLDR
eukprot:SAG31_NODE_2261_length_6065_cov_2.303051_3_plen_551_part_00